MASVDRGSFIGKKITIGDDQATQKLEEKYGTYFIPHKTVEWRNRRPICPYGCGEEGTLLEVIMQDGKAIGIYTHSESVKPFTADLQMSPKPTGRKIAIGPDGEYTYVEDTGIDG